MSQIFRASYTVLRLWETGKYEDAVSVYFHQFREATPAMKEGKRLHEEWSYEVQRTGCLPEVFGGAKVEDTLIEQKMYATFEGIDWIELVGVPDLIAKYCDQYNVYEYKTGVTNSQSYANTMQGGIYGILCRMNSINVDKIAFLHYNQYTKNSDTSYVWITNKSIEETVNWVITLSGEMKQYLEENDLYNRFQNLESTRDDFMEDMLADYTVSESKEE